MHPICSEPGTREKMLACIDDIELVVRAYLEHILTTSSGSSSSGAAVREQGEGAGSGGGGGDLHQLTQLLLARDADLRQLALAAQQQLLVHRQMEGLSRLVDEHNDVLLALQNSLKEAECRLSSAIYQANQKLDSIRASQQRPVTADEVIRCAHRISSTSAVSAPLDWQQGDPRRPYPTEGEMRRGLLGRLSELPVGSLLTPANAGITLNSAAGGVGIDPGTAVSHHQQQQQQHHHYQQQQQPPPPPPSAQFHWTHSGGEVHMGVPGGASVPLGKQTANSTSATAGQDVEVMSTDSSSSSSSDSQ